jgi:hypothetical protein
LAATADQISSNVAYTVGLNLRRTPKGRFIVGDVLRMRAGGQGVRRLRLHESAIRNTSAAENRRPSWRSCGYRPALADLIDSK